MQVTLWRSQHARSPSKTGHQCNVATLPKRRCVVQTQEAATHRHPLLGRHMLVGVIERCGAVPTSQVEEDAATPGVAAREWGVSQTGRAGVVASLPWQSHGVARSHDCSATGGRRRVVSASRDEQAPTLSTAESCRWQHHIRTRWPPRVTSRCQSMRRVVDCSLTRQGSRGFRTPSLAQPSRAPLTIGRGWRAQRQKRRAGVQTPPVLSVPAPSLLGQPEVARQWATGHACCRLERRERALASAADAIGRIQARGQGCS